MSLLKNRLLELRKGMPNRIKSDEEKEVDDLFPGMDELSRIEVANEYKLWRGIVDTDKDLSFDDFIKDLNGDCKLKRKPAVTDEFKAKALHSLRSCIQTPIIRKE